MALFRNVVVVGLCVAGVAAAPGSRGVLGELRAMVKADQALRVKGDSDPQGDETRLHRVLALLAAGQIQGPEAQECAALILQHSPVTLCGDRYQAISLDNYLLAHLLAKSAAEKGRRSARWLAAATLDRHRVFSGLPQKYGTQTVFDPTSNAMVIPPIEPATTDAERAAWDVEPLATFLQRHAKKP